MKKTVIISFLIIATTCNFLACKSETKKENSKKNNAAFLVVKANNKINFTAYKTTDKVAVGGEFKKVDVISGGEGSTIKEAMNNMSFSIPVSSLFTKNESRDIKIQKFFFGIMNNTKLLSGKLRLTDAVNGVAEIKMNGVTQNVPFTYTIVNKTFNMKATIDINNWKASAALAALNKACEVLHKGSDGVSKTWSEVALNITSTFK